jgi:hypothetical protein
MGKRLLNFYDDAVKIGGQKAKLRLSMITCVPSIIAASTPDSDENIKKFQEAMSEIRKEFK